MSERYDVVIIGGGIVGLAVAREITRRFPRLGLAVLEKEARVGAHQSGHNSGVIHSGVYYKPGSIKARTCVSGAAAMVEFCREHGVKYEICGKVIVATSAEELPRLRDLLERGRANGVEGLRMLGPEELREIEPHATGVAALHVPETGVTDYAKVCEKYAELIAAQGGTVRTSTKVVGLRANENETVIESFGGAISAGAVINCAGLFSDRISRMAGERPEVQIVPFRGEYYDLVPARAELVRALIYPVPDPRFPFLGVHDFPSLRASMAQQVADAHLKLTGKSADTSEGTRSMGSRVGAMVADALLAKIILNPERLLDLLGKGLVSANPSPPPGLAAPFAANNLSSVWQTWLNSDYSGANFYVAVPVDRPLDQRFGVRLRLVDWDWKLSGLDLPESMAMDLAQEIARTR